GATHTSRQILDAPVTRYDKVRCNIEQRIQDEVAHRHTRMRDRKVSLVDALSAIDQQVEVDSTRPPAHCRRLPPRLTLKPFEFGQQFARRKLGQQPRSRIDEIWLIL